ncbi:hypothetical protein MHW47_00710 [Streptomyces sp. OfavH-34-F]|uniref:hypothetical protein n=1 Tax=Streptomyces sp. OfavH-34-F TaxID=2917760 RepID=UPI001EF1A198|nr:hypothetical protein [Streptomyces sp. OfavH-34-F]MCG7522976.1 hypothetical protein [Streptomyces sp. OfavH-34-F]
MQSFLCSKRNDRLIRQDGRQLGVTWLPTDHAAGYRLLLDLPAEYRLLLSAGLPEDEEQVDEQTHELQSLLNSVPEDSDFAFASWTRMRALARVLRQYLEQHHEPKSSKNLKLPADVRDAPLTADGSASAYGGLATPGPVREGPTQ